MLDGRPLSAALLDQLRARVESEQLRPELHAIAVGQDAASSVYVKQQQKAAEKAGIAFSQTCLPADATLEMLVQAIQERNRDGAVHGIIVQLPLPESLRAHEQEVLRLVDPAKDVDCFHPSNWGRLALDEPGFRPATAAGILRLVGHYGVETRGKRCVILGKSNIVGKPLALLLGHEAGPGATVTWCDRHTEGVWDITRQADILIVAAGKHHLVKDPEVLREDGQVVIIDVGIHRVKGPDGKAVLQGDVDFEAVRSRCRWITPVPGGVGPMTVAVLLEQVVQAAARHSARHLRQKYRLVGPAWDTGVASAAAT